MNNKCKQKPKNKCHFDIKKYFFKIIYKNLPNKIDFLFYTYLHKKNHYFSPAKAIYQPAKCTLYLPV